jgi:hypothetical protein
MQFRTCLGTLNIRLTEDEIKQLIAKYKIQDKEDLINYAQFCENIDRVFGEGVSPTDVIGGSKSTAVRKMV